MIVLLYVIMLSDRELLIDSHLKSVENKIIIFLYPPNINCFYYIYLSLFMMVLFHISPQT